MTKRIETFLEFAESQDVSPDGLKAAEQAGLLSVHRAGGRKLVLPDEIPHEAIDFAREYDDGDDDDGGGDDTSDGYDDDDDDGGGDDTGDGYDDDDDDDYDDIDDDQ